MYQSTLDEVKQLTSNLAETERRALRAEQELRKLAAMTLEAVEYAVPELRAERARNLEQTLDGLLNGARLQGREDAVRDLLLKLKEGPT
jgi:hypothetical protein